MGLFSWLVLVRMILGLFALAKIVTGRVVQRDCARVYSQRNEQAKEALADYPVTNTISCEPEITGRFVTSTDYQRTANRRYSYRHTSCSRHHPLDAR